jgi:SAM-dependent methyltransferase
LIPKDAIAGDLLQARYDETPYRDQCFEHLDLSRVLGLARLFHLAPSAGEDSALRVLDLACASGVHIRQQAERYPGVRFTGVDFSQTEIELGRKAIVESGADNVELILSDLRELEIPSGEFDLVLCCGAFSWVPDDVKERVFELCRIGLKPTGVAAIAYLTYPGWKQREAVRELLAFRVRDIQDPQERIRQSALLLRLLHAGYEAVPESSHARSLMDVVESMQDSSANVFLHDELGGIHDPCYFTQFVEWAAETGLQYLAEADLGTMALGGLPPVAMGLLQQLAPDFLETQQLIDFVINRSGRTSLIVRDDAPIGRELSGDCLRELHFGTTLVEVTPKNSPAGTSRSFETLRGRRLEVEDDLGSSLLHQIWQGQQAGTSLDGLESRAAEAGHDREAVTRALLALIARGYVDPMLRID